MRSVLPTLPIFPMKKYQYRLQAVVSSCKKALFCSNVGYPMYPDSKGKVTRYVDVSARYLVSFVVHCTSPPFLPMPMGNVRGEAWNKDK